MKFVKSVVLAVLSILLFLCSICLVLSGLMALDSQLTARVIHTVTRMTIPVAYACIGGGIVVFLVALITYSFAGQTSDSSATFTFEGEKGPIDISLRAIEDYIAKHFAETPVVNNVRSRVSTSRDRKMLRVRASISVWSEQNLKSAGEAVQQEITRCLKEGLGLDNVETVPVSVDKIIASKSSKPAPAKMPSDELP
ncbi:MAG: alkaline shock response membrane anchor protein AmaP [Candidatus Hydrogenedentota bacterium]|nr:MAG: alkaline shock response membrane anchor protein AmaP [Candidatus Hydrogenedentota bacterium]